MIPNRVIFSTMVECGRKEKNRFVPSSQYNSMEEKGRIGHEEQTAGNPVDAVITSSDFETSISDIQKLTFETAQGIFTYANMKLDYDTMRILGFYKGDLYTNLAYLASDQCTSGIKLIAYSDRHRTEFLNRGDVRGSVLSQVWKAMDFLDAYNPLCSRIVGIMRTDYKSYPESALKEALLNAIIHRDYSIDVDTLVSVQGNRISISSYGGLKGLSIDDMKIGISSHRNPGLAGLFCKLGLIESFGTGIPHIIGEYRDALIKPSIGLSTNVFKIELPALAPPAVDQLSVDAIMDLARSCESFTRSDAENACGRSRSKAGAVLTAMVEERILERFGNGKNTRYRIPKNRRGSDENKSAGGGRAPRAF